MALLGPFKSVHHCLLSNLNGTELISSGVILEMHYHAGDSLLRVDMK